MWFTFSFAKRSVYESGCLAFSRNRDEASDAIAFYRFIDIPWSVLANSVGKIGGGKRRYGKSSIALLSRISV